ncbi:MAG: winged helix-turn-helix domain-containing protein [Novosphingobium sp.]
MSVAAGSGAAGTGADGLGAHGEVSTDGDAVCPALLDNPLIAAEMSGATERATTLLLGIDDSLIRSHALLLGFGEVLGSDTSLEELEQRAIRVQQAIETVPRQRRHGRLELDLLLRDGIVDGKRLGLHPREFGLLWRLAQSPGKPVTQRELLTEVWRVNFRPETNSLAVHVCRLRAKLASVGLGGIVSTTLAGCYTLAPQVGSPQTALDEPPTQPSLPGGMRRKLSA